MQTDHTVNIATSPEGLWPFLTDVEKIKRWTPELVSIEPTTPGGTAVGATSKLRVKEGGKIVDYAEEIVALEPHRYIEIRMTGGGLGAAPMHLGYRLTPVSTGTDLRITSSWKPSGIVLRLMAPLIKLLCNRKTSTTLGRLKTVAEGA